MRRLLVIAALSVLALAAAARGAEPEMLALADGAGAAADPAPRAEAPLAADRPLRAWPLVEVENAPDGRRDISVLWPIYHRSVGPEVDRLRVLPLWWSVEDPKRSNWAALPLVWSFHDKVADTRTQAVLPLYFRRLDGEDRSRGALFPLYWWGRAPDRATDVLCPLYWRERRPDLERDLVLPLYYRERSPERSKDFFPLYFRTRGPETASDVVFPLYWRQRERDGAADVLFPLVWRFDRPGRSARVVAPFYWDFEGPGGSTQMLWPLYGRSEDASRIRSSALSHLVRWERSKGAPAAGVAVGLPYLFQILDARGTPDETSVRALALGPEHEGPAFIQWTRSGADRSFHAFPLVFAGREGSRRHLVVVPAFGIGSDAARRWGVLPPLLAGWSLPKDDEAGRLRAAVHALYPLISWQREGDERHFRALPLAWWTKRGETEETTHVFPLYSDVRRAESRRQVFLAGAYVRTRTPAKERDDILFPLAARVREGEREHIRALPFLWHESDKGRDLERTIVFPFFFQSHEGERSYTHVLPFYGEHRDGERTFRRFFLGPTYMTSRFAEPGGGERVRTDVLWPFGSYERAPDEAHFRALPLVWHDRKGKDERTFVLGPTYIRTRKAEEARDDLLFPLVASVRKPGKSHFRALPLVWHDRDEAAARSRTIGFPLLWRFREGERDTLLTLPLYGHHVDGDRSATRSVLGPLYVYRRRGTGEGATVAHAPLWPLGTYERGPGRTHVRLFPHSLGTREAGRASDDVLGPLIARSRDGERSHVRALPLLWHDRAPGVANDIVFPLYMRFRRDDRDTLLLGGGLYARTVRGEARGHHLLFPLVAHESGPDRSHTRVLPLFWRDRAPGVERDFLFPLYFRSRSGERETTLFLGPLYARTADGAARTDHILWPLGAYRRDGDRTSYRFAPLVFGGSNERESYTLAPLLFYRQDARAAKPDEWQWRRFLAPVTVLSGGGERRVGVLGSVVHVTTTEEDDYDVRVLHKLVQVASVKGEKTRRLSPVFRYESSEKKKSVDLSILGPVFRYVREGDRSEVRLFHFIRF